MIQNCVTFTGDPLIRKRDYPTEPDVVMLRLAVLELRLDLHVVLRIVRLQLREVLHVPLQRVHDRPVQCRVTNS